MNKPRWRKILISKGYKRLTKTIWLNHETGAEIDIELLDIMRIILGRNYNMLDNIIGSENKDVIDFRIQINELEMNGYYEEEDEG